MLPFMTSITLRQVTGHPKLIARPEEMHPIPVTEPLLLNPSTFQSRPKETHTLVPPDYPILPRQALASNHECASPLLQGGNHV